MKTKKTNREKDLQVIQSGNMEEIEAAIKAFAFDQTTQCDLLDDPKYADILSLYMGLRKLGKQPISKLLSTKPGKYSLELIRKAVIGHVLSERNEELLEENYPELLNDYLAAKKEIEDVAEKEAQKYRKPCSLSMETLFTPELRAKLSL